MLLMCSLLLYVKRIIMFNQQYGRYAFVLGVVFICSNLLAGAFNFFIGTVKLEDLNNFKRDSHTLWCLMYIPFYAITEFVPAIVFGVVMYKYGEVVANPAPALLPL